MHIQIINKFFLQRQLLSKQSYKQNIQNLLIFSISAQRIKMFEHSTLNSIRIKKSLPLDSKYMKSTNGFAQTKYSEPLGKFFLEKNKDRICQLDTQSRSNKYSERYLINKNKLEKMNDKELAYSMNKTVANSLTGDDFRITVPSFNQNRTSQSHRSHVMTVNLKQLPKIHPSATFSGSHTKIYNLKQELDVFSCDVSNLTTKTNDIRITFDVSKNNLLNHCTQVQRNLKRKINDLQRLTKQIKQDHSNRSEQICENISILKQKNIHLKEYLGVIQQKIQGIENILGITTAHHKHYV